MKQSVKWFNAENVVYYQNQKDSTVKINKNKLSISCYSLNIESDNLSTVIKLLSQIYIYIVYNMLLN